MTPRLPPAAVRRPGQGVSAELLACAQAARHSCDPIFDEWIVCVMRSECYKAKDAQLRARGGQAGHAELKQVRHAYSLPPAPLCG